MYRNQSAQSNKIDVQTQELYQLALFIQEASMREEILRQKITSLQSFIDQAKETSENGWLVSLIKYFKLTETFFKTNLTNIIFFRL